MEMIMNEGKRKSIFKKRLLTMKKKAEELSKLCDIEVCMICYGSNGSLHTWPDDARKVRQTAMKYKSLSGKEKSKKRFDLDGFLEKKQRHNENKNRNRRFPTWDERLDGYSRERLTELNGFLESKLRSLDKRVQLLNLQKEGSAIQAVDSNRRKDCFKEPVDDYKPYLSNPVPSTPIDKSRNVFANPYWTNNHHSYPGESCRNINNIGSMGNAEVNNGYQDPRFGRGNGIGSFGCLGSRDNRTGNAGLVMPHVGYNAWQFYQSSIHPPNGYQNQLAYGIGRDWPCNPYYIGFVSTENTNGRSDNANTLINNMIQPGFPGMITPGALHETDHHQGRLE